MIGLYLSPPEHAAVFSVDEKTAIQALDRNERLLQLSPERAESHGFEYKCNGTLSLFAAVNTHSGVVISKTAARHTSGQFVTFLEEVKAWQPAGREIRVIRDNVSSHETARVRACLQANPNVHMRYTPTYSSWLNQTGSRAFSAVSSRAACSPVSWTWTGRSFDSSANTTRMLDPSNGSTTIPHGGITPILPFQ